MAERRRLAEGGESQAVGKSANRFSGSIAKDHVPCWGHYTKVL